MSRAVEILTRKIGQVGALLIGGRSNPVMLSRGSGAPVDGTTGAGEAAKSSIYFDYTNGDHYKNIGTKAAPVWVPLAGGLAGSVEVYNGSGGPLTAGTLVYLSGWDATTGLPKVSKADADAGPLTYARYVLKAAIADGASGLAGSSYTLTAQNTNSASAAGDPVYLSATAGGWTLTIPSGVAHLQIVGRVGVKSATLGTIEFFVDPPIAGFLKSTVIAGGAAGDLTATGVAVGDRLVSVTRLDRDATAANINISALTAEFAISAADTINNAAGTDTTGDALLVTYLDRT